MIVYKTNMLQLLKENGYNTTRLRREKILGESYIHQLRHGEIVSWAVIDKICRLTGLDVGDLVTHIADTE